MLSASSACRSSELTGAVTAATCGLTSAAPEALSQTAHDPPIARGTRQEGRVAGAALLGQDSRHTRSGLCHRLVCSRRICYGGRWKQGEASEANHRVK